MQLLILLLLMTTCRSHKVVDSNEDLSPEHFISSNSTTLLHPVSNRTDDRTSSESSASTWKIATSLADQENATSSKEHLDTEPTTENPEKASVKFKPSPQVGTVDTLGTIEDNFVVPTSESFGPFSPVLRRPPAGFFSSYREERQHPINNIPPEIFKYYHRFPYMEKPILTRTKDDWTPHKPALEAPKFPAEIYSLPETSKDRPEFGLDFHGDLREMALKKRSHPMQGLMRLLATLIPVGVIVSALAPGVINIETSGNTNGNGNGNPIKNNIFRRTDTTAAGLPAISERCRRRLLCELQLDHHYQRSSSGAGCRRMWCEDPAALRLALGWLLHPPGSAHAGNNT